jgi:hypothetical protein
MEVVADDSRFDRQPADEFVLDKGARGKGREIPIEGNNDHPVSAQRGKQTHLGVERCKAKDRSQRPEYSARMRLKGKGDERYADISRFLTSGFKQDGVTTVHAVKIAYRINRSGQVRRDPNEGIGSEQLP